MVTKTKQASKGLTTKAARARAMEEALKTVRALRELHLRPVPIDRRVVEEGAPEGKRWKLVAGNDGLVVIMETTARPEEMRSYR